MQYNDISWVERCGRLKKGKVIIGSILIIELLAIIAIVFLMNHYQWRPFQHSKDAVIAAQMDKDGIIVNNDEGANGESNVDEFNSDQTDEPMKSDTDIIVGDNGTDITDEDDEAPRSEEAVIVDEYDTIVISAAGDVTLGRDKNYGYERSFDHEFKLQGNDFGFFFRNVKDIFEKDDLTIVNLETTLTNSIVEAEKKFRFRADPSYVEILKEGNIEVVSIANNHTRDFLEVGYKDTLKTLESASIGYFGYEHKYLTEIRGINVGVLGYVSWDNSSKQKEQINGAMKELRDNGADIVIIMFHWGIERDYYPSAYQRDLAHYVIDQGADLVLGAHPHVLQGIEEYKGKKIVYSLGNFSFGGNKNPSDKDTMIYIHKFNFKNGELISEDNEIIPCSISSVKDRNNYQPTPLEGSEKERVLKKIEKYSSFN